MADPCACRRDLPLLQNSVEETMMDPTLLVLAAGVGSRYGGDKVIAPVGPGGQDCAMVGFVLRNTLSEFGTVARGVCQIDGENFLLSVTERTGIEKDDGGVKYTDDAGNVHRLSGDELVSLNMWGFRPHLF